MTSEHDNDRLETLRDLIREGAPHLTATPTERSCIDIHIAFWLYQAELMHEFDAGRINKHIYLKLFNERARFMVEQDKEILGDDFYRIFGEEGDAIENLINPEIFLADGPAEENFMRYG